MFTFIDDGVLILGFLFMLDLFLMVLMVFLGVSHDHLIASLVLFVDFISQSCNLDSQVEYVH